MTAAIFKAVGRGYSARNILQSISRSAPEYANRINTAYYAGYAAQDILSRIASQKDGKNYSPDQFMTEHEKTLRNHDNNKKYATMEAIGMAGTVGAAGVGIAQLYSYLQKQKALHPDEIIIPNRKLLTGKQKTPHTIHQGRPQIGHDKKQIGYEEPNQKSIANSPLMLDGPRGDNRRSGPESPKGPPPFKNVPPVVFNRNYPGQNEPPPPPNPENAQKPYIKSVKVLEGLGEANRIMNMIEGGMTTDEMKLVLPMMMKKEAYNIISKGDEMDKLLNDMQEYVKENPREQRDLKNTGFDIKPTLEEPQQEQPFQSDIQPAQQQNQNIQQPKNQQINPIMSPQFNEPTNEVQNQLNHQQESFQPEIETERPSRSVTTNTGESGDLIDVKNGVATVNVNGKEKKFKFSDLETSPQNVEDAFRFVINSVPEEKKSTALMGTIRIPNADLLVTSFYNGDAVWYSQASEKDYNDIVFSKNAPKGEARTGMAEYNPNVSDSRGNAFWKFKNREIYSKENEGKTWGYIKDKYSFLDHIQPIIHKISKERYDSEGKLITPKPRVKKEPAKPKENPKVEESKAKPTDWEKEVEKIDNRTNLLIQSIKLLEKNYPKDDDSYYNNIKSHDSQLSIYEKEINELKKRKDDLLRKNQKFEEKKSEFEPNEETQSEWEKRIKKIIPGITEKAIKLMSYKYSKKFKD